MSGKYNDKIISFRLSVWERELIKQRVTVSGVYKKNFSVQRRISRDKSGLYGFFNSGS